MSSEYLRFEEDFERQSIVDTEERLLCYGVTFGWDIRPNRLQKWILRTNLRWFPKLKLEVSEGQEISFDNLEFNFIQFILFPNRLKL